MFDDNRLGGAVDTQDWERSFGEWWKLMWCLFFVFTFDAKEDVIAGLNYVRCFTNVLVKVSLV